MARKDDPRRDDDSGTQIVTKVRPKTKRPSLYKVLLLNDDYTPMDFVVYILERFFNKAPEEATRIMLHVHFFFDQFRAGSAARASICERAQPRVCDAGASAPVAPGRPRRGRRHACLRCRSRSAAGKTDRLYRQ
jgi:hypothetical protein